MKKIKNALVSVSNKEGLEDLAQYFIENEVNVVSTGGTFKKLKELGVEVTQVSDVTNFPEVMGGRVKTLNPMIHMGLLSRQGNNQDEKLIEEHQALKFDLLVVNLYPFLEKKSEGLKGQDLVEFIDVGGPSMIRAGAKNFSRLVTLTSPKDYDLLNSNAVFDYEVRKRLAAKAFQHLSDYDSAVASWLFDKGSLFEEKTLRYGENPQQKAKWSFNYNDIGLHQAKILQGKELSFNNLVDLSAAIETLNLFKEPTVISVKHNNPCGVGSADTIEKALDYSLNADPQSVFGGIVALNREVSAEAASRLTELFLECVVAPALSKEASDILGKKKNLRVLVWPEMVEGYFLKEDFRRVCGGKLIQEADAVAQDIEAWSIKSGKVVSPDVARALLLSWKVVSRLKSNAIAICGEHFSLGLGMGQVNRVDAVSMAIERWQRFHSDYKGPVVLASDAFFPFADSIEKIAEAGIKIIVQPGGSIKDQEVITKAEELGLTMYFSGKRHFLH